jgi:murein DD-endopeptidase MepM/ murein hydrolase activator NlpD
MRADLRKPDRRTSGSRKVAVLPTGVFASTSPDTQCPAGASDGASSGFMWPLRAPVLIVRPFDGPAQPWLAGHRGVDLHAPPGTPVVAPAAGVVSFAGIVVDRHLIVIDHGDLRSTLEPVFPCLAPGTFVAAGQQVGVVSAEPPHAPDTVHWGVRRGDVYLDPTLLVCPAPRAVLLE